MTRKEILAEGVSNEERPEMTPREKVAKLAAMSPEDFNRFMLWNFNRICKQPRPNNSGDRK